MCIVNYVLLIIERILYLFDISNLRNKHEHNESGEEGQKIMTKTNYFILNLTLMN